MTQLRAVIFIFKPSASFVVVIH